MTIPKALRDRLGIRPGQTIDFQEEAGRLVATKTMPETAARGVYGILKLGKTTDRLIEELRGRPERT